VRKILIACVVVGLLAGAAAYYRTAASRTPIVYPTDRIEYGPIAEVVKGTGLIEVRNPVVVVSPSIIGLVGEVQEIAPEADFGREVKKGQKLLQLDSKAAGLKLKQAEALVALASKERDAAQAALEGTTNIRDQMNRSSSFSIVEQRKAEMEYNVAQARVRSAEAKLKEAEVGLELARTAKESTTVKSPADGIIIDRKVVVGQTVGPQLTTPLFVIAPNLRDMRVLAQIAQGDIGRILPNQKATVSLFTSGEKTNDRPGTVQETRLMPTVLPGGATIPGSVFYSAVVDVENNEGPAGWELRPGMTAEVTINLRGPKIAWKLPKEAVDLALDDQHISREAHARLEKWQSLPRPGIWRRIWVLDDGGPWPVYVRLVSGDGEKAIEDDRYVEVLEWDWGDKHGQALNPDNVKSIPPVIINKPEPTPGVIDRLLKSFKASG
jgi:HlyD family secretion protein